MNPTHTLFQKIGGHEPLSHAVDLFFDKMQDDYRINRFFNDKPQTEQSGSLKAYLATVFGGPQPTAKQALDLLDDFFFAAFARTNSKGSLVTGADFAIIAETFGGADERPTHFLTDGHAHLLRFAPDDFHYDVVMEHLKATLNQLGLPADTIAELLTCAERARSALLGRN